MEREPRRERFLNREQATAILSLIGISMLSLAAFTERQKAWIRDRDNNHCQFPNEHDCNGEEKTLHVHHILPQRYLGLFKVDADFAENGISICENAHIGNGTHTPDKVIHPDMREAVQHYREGDKKAYDKAFQERQKKLQQREVYWNTQWDRQLTVLALKNTNNYQEPFPEKKGKK